MSASNTDRRAINQHALDELDSIWAYAKTLSMVFTLLLTEKISFILKMILTQLFGIHNNGIIIICTFIVNIVISFGVGSLIRKLINRCLWWHP